MEEKRKNLDEQIIFEIAQKIPKFSTRYATKEEDCGYQKADVVLENDFQKYYLQVSHQPKSKKQQSTLEKRGTHHIYTHNFKGMPIDQQEILKKIKTIISK